MKALVSVLNEFVEEIKELTRKWLCENEGNKDEHMQWKTSRSSELLVFYRIYFLNRAKDKKARFDDEFLCRIYNYYRNLSSWIVKLHARN